eukprot:767782-Hanusia_phi.AAC.2
MSGLIFRFLLKQAKMKSVWSRAITASSYEGLRSVRGGEQLKEIGYLGIVSGRKVRKGLRVGETLPHRQSRTADVGGVTISGGEALRSDTK